MAPPTGEKDIDRASILAALDEVEPGGTVQFAAGRYLVGDVIRIPTPRLTLLGHPDGTTLRGCTPDEFERSERDMAAAATAEDAMAANAAWIRCGLLELTGGQVNVRGLTFELSRLGLLLGCCHLDRRFETSTGGYLVEGNTFRNSHNGIRPWTTEPSTIRGNRFVNTFHAISGAGSHLHVLDNDISAPEPGRVPGVGHVSFAVAMSSIRARTAETIGLDDNGVGVVIAGNRIEGHPDGIFLTALPGTSFRSSKIRDNTIRVEWVPIPPSGVRPYIVDVTDQSDSTIVGIPLSLYPRSVPGAADDGTEEGRFQDNLIAGNRLIGADGVAIAIRRGSGNRIDGNTITRVERREPFPGNTVLSSSEAWQGANGSAIWLSPGSDGNDIVGNTFEDVAAAAVVLEGDNNQVEVASPDDEVRDLG
ncbi:MAG: right-handed parallel beta-helix repeat-containing protein, partial [Halobacteriales archaeon]|nr:right-handed parallel beta-helix repeat-containing protein [Halobacteriales archaeon]